MLSKHNTDSSSSNITTKNNIGKPKRTFQGVLRSRPVSSDKNVVVEGGATASSLPSRASMSRSALGRKQVTSPMSPSSTTTPTTPTTTTTSVAADRHQSVSFAADSTLGASIQKRGGGGGSIAGSFAASTRSVSSSLTGSTSGSGYNNNAASRGPLQEVSVHLLSQQLKATYTQLDRAVGVVQHESSYTLLLQQQHHTTKNNSSRGYNMYGSSSFRGGMDTPLQEDHNNTSSGASMSSPTTTNHTIVSAASTSITSPLQPSHPIASGGVSRQSSSLSLVSVVPPTKQSSSILLAGRDESAWMEEVVEVVAQLMRTTNAILGNRQRSSRTRYETLFPRGLQLQYIFSGGRDRAELWTSQESARWIEIAIEAASSCLNLDTLQWEKEGANRGALLQVSSNAIVDTERGTYTRIWHSKKAARHWVGACKRILEAVSRFDLDSRFAIYHSCLLIVHGKAVTVTFLVPIVPPTTLNHHQQLLNGNGRIQMEIVTSNAKLCTRQPPPLLRRTQELIDLQLTSKPPHPPSTLQSDDNDAVLEEVVDDSLPFALTTIESIPLKEATQPPQQTNNNTTRLAFTSSPSTYISTTGKKGIPRYIQRLRALYNSRKTTTERDLWLLPAPMTHVPDKLPTPHAAFCNTYVSQQEMGFMASSTTYQNHELTAHTSSLSFITADEGGSGSASIENSAMKISGRHQRMALSSSTFTAPTPPYHTTIPSILSHPDNLPDSYTGIPITASTTPLNQANSARASSKLHAKLLGASQRLLAKAYAESKSRIPGACQYQHGGDDDDALTSPTAPTAHSDPSSQTEEDEEAPTNTSQLPPVDGAVPSSSLLTSPLLSPNSPPSSSYWSRKQQGVVGDTSQRVSSTPHGTFRAAALKGYYYSRDSGFRRDMCMNSSLRARHLYILFCVADGFCMSRRELVQQRTKMFAKSENDTLSDNRARLPPPPTAQMGGSSLISEIAQKRGFILMATAVRKQLLVLMKSEMVARTLKCLIGQFQDKLRDRLSSSSSSSNASKKKTTSALDIANRYLEYLLSSSASTLETFLMSTVAGPLVVKFGVPLDELSAPVLRATIKHLTKQGMQSPLPENITDTDIDSYCSENHSRLERQWQARVFTPESISSAQQQQRVTLPKSLFGLAHDDVDVAFIVHMLCASFGYEVNIEKRVFTVAAKVSGGGGGEAGIITRSKHNGRSIVALSTFSAPAGRRRRPLEPLWPTQSEAKSLSVIQILSFPHGRGYDTVIPLDYSESMILGGEEEVCTSIGDDDTRDQVVAVESDFGNEPHVVEEDEELPQQQSHDDHREEDESLFGVVPDDDDKHNVPNIITIKRLPKDLKRKYNSNDAAAAVGANSSGIADDNEEGMDFVSIPPHSTTTTSIPRPHGYRRNTTIPIDKQYMHTDEVAVGDSDLGIAAPRFPQDASPTKPTLSQLLRQLLLLPHDDDSTTGRHFEEQDDDHEHTMLDFVPTRTIRKDCTTKRRRIACIDEVITPPPASSEEVCDCISTRRRHTKGRRDHHQSSNSSRSKKKANIISLSRLPKGRDSSLEPPHNIAARLSVVVCMQPGVRRTPRDLPPGHNKKPLARTTTTSHKPSSSPHQGQQQQQHHIHERIDDLTIPYKKPNRIDVGVQAIVANAVLTKDRPSSPSSTTNTSSPFIRVNPLDCNPADLPTVMRKLRSATPLFRYSSWERIRAYFEKGSIYAMMCQPSEGSVEEDYSNQTTYQYKPQMAAMYVVVTSPIHLKLDIEDDEQLVFDQGQHEQEVSSPAVVASMTSSSPQVPSSKMLMPGIMGLRLQKSLQSSKVALTKRAGSATPSTSSASVGTKQHKKLNPVVAALSSVASSDTIFRDVGTMTSKAILRSVRGSIFTEGSASYRPASPSSKRPTTALIGTPGASSPSSPATTHADHQQQQDPANRTVLSKGEVAAIAGVDWRPQSSPNASTMRVVSSGGGDGSPPPSIQERIKIPLTDMYCERGAAFWVITPAAYTVLAENYSKKKQVSHTYTTSATPKK